MHQTSKIVSNCGSIFRRDLFNGQTAIVTGGATGIGKAIVSELLHLGCKVMIASRNIDNLEKMTAQMKSRIPKDSIADVASIVCNIRKEEQVQNLMSETIKKFGKIDFLVNNAGGQFPSAAENISLKGWNAVIETNLTGTFLCCKEVFNQTMEKHGGVIINIIADMWKGFPGMSHTGAARSAVDNLTKSLAVEWARSNVRINAVAPGSSIYSETAAANYKMGPEIFNSQKPNIPLKRLGTVEEISATVCFLLSPAASFITGETIKVDGGHWLYRPSSIWDIPDHNNNKPYKWLDEDITPSKL